jgi:rhodanese-related sulfurtransferase
MPEEVEELTPAEQPVKIQAAEVKRRMDIGEHFAFVDARMLDEWIESARRIVPSVRMAPAEVSERAKGVPRGRTIVTYCNSPDEEFSTRVAAELIRLGFSNVHPLIGGLDAWCAVGGLVERT